MISKKILIADQDKEFVLPLINLLSSNDYKVLHVNNGKDALNIAMNEELDLVILEVSLPELDGFSVCRLLRAEETKIPVIFLTNNVSDIHAVIGFELGAQDYIRKSIQMRELIARINAHFKKNQTYLQKKILLQELEIDIEQRQVKYKGQIKDLTNKEFQLLYTLASCPNKVFERKELLNKVWKYPVDLETRTVDLHIGYLRKKLEDSSKRPALFKTIRGVGYYLSSSC